MTRSSERMILAGLLLVGWALWTAWRQLIIPALVAGGGLILLASGWHPAPAPALAPATWTGAGVDRERYRTSLRHLDPVLLAPMTRLRHLDPVLLAPPTRVLLDRSAQPVRPAD